MHVRMLWSVEHDQSEHDLLSVSSDLYVRSSSVSWQYSTATAVTSDEQSCIAFESLIELEANARVHVHFDHHVRRLDLTPPCLDNRVRVSFFAKISLLIHFQKNNI